jgi:hypothetical protein
MSPRALLVQLTVWALALIGVNAAIDGVSRNSLPRQIVRAIEASGPVTDVFAGNSLAVSGFDTQAYEAARPGARALNIGLGWSFAPEHDILLRRALRLRPAHVYYSSSDTMLTDVVPSRWQDLVGNRAMAYYIDPETAIRFFAPEGGPQTLAIRVTSRIPMVADRFSIWPAVERVRRQLGGIGMPPEPVNRFGRVEDFASFALGEEPAFQLACREVVRLQTPLTPAVRDMLALVRQAGGTMMIVEMPRPSDHRRRVYTSPEWAAYQAYIAERIREAGGHYIVASDWVADDQFSDPLHLGPRGAAVLSGRLADITK